MKKGLSILLVFTVILFLFACGKASVENSTANLGSSWKTTDKMNTESTTLFKGYTYVNENGSTVCVDGYLTENTTDHSKCNVLESHLCSVPTKPSENPSSVFQAIRTNGRFFQNQEYPDFPYTVIIETSDELKKYIDDNEEKFDFSRKDKVYADTTIGFLDAVDKYDDEYFKENSLIIAVTAQPSGSIRYTDARLICPPCGKYYDTLIYALVLTEYHPYMGTDDCADWHIIVEAKKGTYADEIELQIDVVREETPDYMK